MIAPAIVGLGARDAQFWLDAANQAVRSYCGWHVAPVITETLKLDGNGSRKLLIPSGKVLNVSAATNDGVDVLAQIDTSEKGMIALQSGYWTRRFGGVVITLEHGYESEEVSDIAGVIASLSARSMSVPAGIAAQGIGPANVRYTIAPMLKEELAILAPYRLTWLV